MAANRSQMLQLITQQCRLRHLCSVCARNVKMSSAQYKLLTKDSGRLGYYFTLHVDNDYDAFYTSEILNGDVTDFNWKSFNWPLEVDNVNLSLTQIFIKIYATSTKSTVNQEIISQKFCFKNMHYLGEQIPKDGHHFRPNTIIFEMFSGFYVGSESSINLHPVSTNKVLTSRSMEIFVTPESLRNSYDFSTLKRVHTVQRAVRQTRASVLKVRSIIHKKLAETEETVKKLSAKEYLINQLHILRDELEIQRQSLQRIQKTCAERSHKNKQRHLELAKHRIALRKLESKLAEEKHDFIDTRENLLKTVAQLNIRRRHLMSEISCIYPIQQTSDRGYTICGVNLPDSESFVGKDETMLSVALGYVCHLAIMVSQFLNTPLRYPVIYMGSRSRIYDHLLSSISDSEREFPLFCRGANKMQFHYGVYLLNKNISQLKLTCGLGTQDLRQTLFNAKALLELRQATKLNQPVTAPVNIEKNPSAIIKRIPQLIEDASGSTDSLNTEEAKRRTALWKSSPEHSRSGTLSLSLDHGLDEIVRENNFKRKLQPNGSDEHYKSGAVSHIPAELHLSEPSLADPGGPSHEKEDCSETVNSNPVKKAWLPLQIYASESDGELPIQIIKDNQSIVPT